MVDPYLGEIRLIGTSFAPVGWSLCDGTLLPIAQYDALFTLLGTTYGGDGQTTFGVPDLRSRFPVHRSATLPLGAAGGVEEVTLTSDQVAGHAHAFQATTALADQATPGGNTTAQPTTLTLYVEDTPAVALTWDAIVPMPGGQMPHDNMHPYQVVNYIIALEGVYPPPS